MTLERHGPNSGAVEEAHACHRPVVSTIRHQPVVSTVRHEPVVSTVHHQPVASTFRHRPVSAHPAAAANGLAPAPPPIPADVW